MMPMERVAALLTPIMAANGLDGVIPFSHPSLAEWRSNFKGIRHVHEPTNLAVYGAPDDVWTDGKALVVVDYKATASKDRVITLDPAWVEGGNNWAVTAAAIDSDLVKYPLEIRTGTDGMDGWADALDEMIGGVEGISPVAPVDLAQAAIGPGMAVFSRYAKVLEADGEQMKVRTALQLINQELDTFFAEK